MKRSSLVITLWAVTACALLGSPELTWGQTDWYVDDNAPGDPAPGDPTISAPCENGSMAHPFDAIQEAIDAADPNDTVIVADGTYTGAGNRDIDFGGKAITVCSANGPESCEIDCEGTETAPHRGFYFHSQEDPNSVLDGFTITNGYVYGYDDGGGGIRCLNSSPVIRNCILKYNETLKGDGGGLYNENSHPSVISCTFYYNTVYLTMSGAPRQGGGGGMYNKNSNPTVINCNFEINNVRVHPDYAGAWPPEGNGGGMYNENSNPTVVNCIFSYNSPMLHSFSYDDGGGMYNGNSHPTLINCTFYGNGAYYVTDGGGGIFNYNSNPVITNCIFWEDFPYEIENDGSSAPVVSYCDVQGSYPGSGNINLDPNFASELYLKSQVGRWNPTIEAWVVDTQHSPCIDAGDPNSDWSGELWPHGERINMGAYGGTPQASMSLSNVGNVADLNHDGIVNLVDWGLFVDKWKSQQVLLAADLDRNGVVDIRDLYIFAINHLWRK